MSDVDVHETIVDEQSIENKYMNLFLIILNLYQTQNAIQDQQKLFF